jgi:hypothetical protein
MDSFKNSKDIFQKKPTPQKRGPAFFYEFIAEAIMISNRKYPLLLCTHHTQGQASQALQV